MKPNQAILYIKDVAELLGKTESATVSAYQRGQIPGAFKLLGRVAWNRESLQAWLAGLESGAQEGDGGKRRKGRRRQSHVVDITPRLAAGNAQGGQK